MSDELTLGDIKSKIHLIRGQRVILDSDLAKLYGVETKNLNKAVRRNSNRFPKDFLFQLTEIEEESLRFQIGTSNPEKEKRGGRRYLPMVFTEQGVAMLSSVLRSERAVQVNIEIMRTFVKLRGLLLTHQELSQRLLRLEKKYDSKFKIIFDAIKIMMNESENQSRRKIGIVKDD